MNLRGFLLLMNGLCILLICYFGVKIKKEGMEMRGLKTRLKKINVKIEKTQEILPLLNKLKKSIKKYEEPPSLDTLLVLPSRVALKIMELTPIGVQKHNEFSEYVVKLHFTGKYSGVLEFFAELKKKFPVYWIKALEIKKISGEYISITLTLALPWIG